jgi:hypothetical protein
MEAKYFEYKVTESKDYYVFATGPEEALRKFGNYQHYNEGPYETVVENLGEAGEEDLMYFNVA